MDHTVSIALWWSIHYHITSTISHIQKQRSCIPTQKQKQSAIKKKIKHQKAPTKLGLRPVVDIQEGRDLLWPGSPMPSYWLRALGVRLGTDLRFIGMVEALVLSPITL